MAVVTPGIKTMDTFYVNDPKRVPEDGVLINPLQYNEPYRGRTPCVHLEYIDGSTDTLWLPEYENPTNLDIDSLSGLIPTGDPRMEDKKITSISVDKKALDLNIKGITFNGAHIRSLNVPEGIKWLTLFRSSIKEIELPSTIEMAVLPVSCSVPNLEKALKKGGDVLFYEHDQNIFEDYNIRRGFYITKYVPPTSIGSEIDPSITGRRTRIGRFFDRLKRLFSSQ